MICTPPCRSGYLTDADGKILGHCPVCVPTPPPCAPCCGDGLVHTAARPHTDQHDERMDAIWCAVPKSLPPAFKMAAERLRAEGYAEPVIVAPPCLHHCRGCTVELEQGQPCGSYCHRCADIEADEHARLNADDQKLLYAMLFGLAAGFPLYVLLFMLAGWM